MTSRAPEPGIPPVLLQCGREGWRKFSDPVEVIRTSRLQEVLPALREIETATRRGFYAAGFLTYEAAAAFDSAFVTRPPGALPLLWFGIYRRCTRTELEHPARHSGAPAPEWQPSIDRAGYGVAVDRIRDRIARGDTYQVNFTWRLKARFDQDPYAYFLELGRHNPGRYSAFVDIGTHVVCSFSPELFFRLENDRLVCRPMKGTAPRGLFRAEDEKRRRALASSVKDRAENVMIVDMVRNDVGRIARPGSVRATKLFEVEVFPTVLQMTSTVEARSDASPSEVLAALFPCASITGAPKIETMKIIACLEEEPREIYTGAIGYFGPRGRSLFSVAIRTVLVDRAAATAVYGTGGGIVWDSEPDSEFAEGRTKAQLLHSSAPDYALFETLRWDASGFHLLERHLARLADSADLLGFPWDEAFARKELSRIAAKLSEAGSKNVYRVRLRLERDGSIAADHHPMRLDRSSWLLALADEPIDPNDKFFFHKTTERSAYDSFRRQAPDADDVLLWNPNGELTETTRANVALRLQGSWYTPPVGCGLLAGTERGQLLADGVLTERVLTLEELPRADAVAIVNSVRGWIPAQLATAGSAAASSSAAASASSRRGFRPLDPG